VGERNYYLGFSTISGIGPAKFRKLLGEHKTAKAAWESLKPKFSIKDYLEELKKKNVWFVTLLDENYPQILKEIKNPPFVLYGKGHKSLLNDENTIGIVGARRTTEYGREVTKILTEELVLSGLTVISGLALGVDAISHMTTLENDGKTIAVLGCGVDCCNPRENQSIYDKILESGNCIISEFPLGMKPTQWTFPARNRIIAGLSQAVLVTEGAEDSGSLITAQFALKFGRKVFAVPGPITSQMSKGPYKLIQKGARLVTSGEDILKDLKLKTGDLRIKKTFKKGDSDEENLILRLLNQEHLHFDELVKKTGFKSAKLSGILSLMEIKGLIKSQNNGYFGIAS
jgi:DNA processing protein